MERGGGSGFVAGVTVVGGEDCVEKSLNCVDHCCGGSCSCSRHQQ